MAHQIPGENFALLNEAVLRHGVSVIGSAPYVEPSVEKAKKNINLIFDIADTHRLNYVDFHLDYNLDAKSEPLIYEVIAQTTRRYHRTMDHLTSSITAASDTDLDYAKRPCPRITIGHATRLQLFSPDEWRALADAISGFPITFVGLPQSDMYMQGRAFQDEPLGAPRGTLRVPYLAQRYGIEIAMSVNNVDNPFTPQGSLDPLSLCSFGVGIFQASTPEDIRVLMVCHNPFFFLTTPALFIDVSVHMMLCASFRMDIIFHRRVIANLGSKSDRQATDDPCRWLRIQETKRNCAAHFLTASFSALRDPDFQDCHHWRQSSSRSYALCR